MRIDALTGQAFTLSKQFADDGTVADVGIVTYTIVDGNGTTVTTGTALKTGAGTTTAYAVTVPAQANPTVLRITSTPDTPVTTSVDTIEVTRNAIFTEAQARAWKGSGNIALFADTAVWTDAAIAEWRVRITDQFERQAGRSYVRRYCRAEGPGTGTYRLSLLNMNRTLSDGSTPGGVGAVRGARRIISATIAGTTVLASDIKVDNGILHRTDGVWDVPTATDPLNVVIEWEYGDDPVDSEAELNGLRMLAANAAVGTVSGYATSYSNEDGNQSFTQDGWAYPPKVWSWLKGTSRRIGIA